MDTNDQIITSVIDAHVSGQPEGENEDWQPGVRVPAWLTARRINNNSR
jgi:hypothetical protein